MELKECTKGYRYGNLDAPKCHGWHCECPLKGNCKPPSDVKVCQVPCKKHFPEPIKCKGGRGRFMPNGCLRWQCNCPEFTGPCIPPYKTPYGEVICKDPCEVHSSKPKCSDCGCDLEVYEVLWGYCSKCYVLDLYDDDDSIELKPESECRETSQRRASDVM